MTQELEWGGLQQLILLMQSVLLGLVLGVVFDLMNGFGYPLVKSKCFLLDVLFCVLAAFFTFYCSLALTDGRLHPVLFVGLVNGVFVEHVVIGRWVSRFTRKILRVAGSITGYIDSHIVRICGKIHAVFLRLTQNKRKKSKNIKKTRKKHHFFQKKA